MARMIALLPLWLGCTASPAPKPPATPQIEEGDARQAIGPTRIAAGKECVHATVRCDGAACAVEVQNECASPVACELIVSAACASASGTAPTRATAGDTFAVDTAGTLEAAADCGQATASGARPQQLLCRSSPGR